MEALPDFLKTGWLVIVVIVAICVAAAWFLRRRGPDLPRLLPQQSPQPANGTEIGASTVIIGTWVIIFALIGMGAMALWSYGYVGQSPSNGKFTANFGVDILVAAAAGGVGALLGFVFGIPRTLDPASRVAVAAAAAQTGPAASSQAALAANTNLERISDWLTTLLIGATLVQAQNVVSWIGSLGDALSNPSGLTNKVVVPLIVVYYFALAFLGVYLITRLYLTYALQQTLALLTGVAAASLAIVPKSLPEGNHGQAYPSTTIQATGGTSPLKWSITPDLPAGLVADPATGTIAGTPTAVAPNAPYTVVVMDSSIPPVSASATFQLGVT